MPAIMLIAWLAVASFGGPAFGKLAGVSNNDQASYLPASAESTTVNAIQKEFTGSKAIPAVVVLVSATPLTRADLAQLAPLGAKLGAVTGVQRPQPPATTTVAGPIPSADGRAVQFIVPITDTNDVKTVIADLRTTVHSAAPASVSTYVTGPAGFTADLIGAFGGIDGILLVVAVGAVFVILLLVYRSIVLPFVVLLTSLFGLTAAVLSVYALASWGWVTLTGQSQGILSILVIGAATDYSLLIVARYRESLLHIESAWTSIGRALRGAFEPIVASGATVIIALLCLEFSDLNSNKSLGPIGAIGIMFAMLSAVTLLPAALVLFGRAAFWPFRAAFRLEVRIGSASPDPGGIHGLEGIRGLWRRVGTLIARRTRATWITSLLVLCALALGLLQLQANGVPQSDVVLSSSDAADGQRAAAAHFPSGAGSPVVIVADQARADATLAAVTATPGIDSATIYAGENRPGTGAAPVVKNGKVLIDAVLSVEPDSHAAQDVVSTLRTTLPRTDPGAIVGGVTAIALDTNTTAQGDLVRIIPIVLGVILVILMLLLRSILAPVLLIGSVVVSYAAALGASALVFDHVFAFPGADPSVPLFGFVFLVALGVDYNIFLMTRVREESVRLGTRPGILLGLGLTGSVITSAGVVLAATFAALAVIPILFLVQIAFIVAFGVLLDTIVVRSMLVPAISYDIGGAIWWPSRLRHRTSPARIAVSGAADKG